MTDTPNPLADIDLSGAVHYGWDDVRGWLVFAALPAEAQRLEDQTQNFDHEQHRRPSVHRIRPSTDVEKLLLGHLGFAVPNNLETVVKYPSGGIRRREWPALIRQREAMQ